MKQPLLSVSEIGVALLPITIGFLMATLGVLGFRASQRHGESKPAVYGVLPLWWRHRCGTAGPAEQTVVKRI
jgi:hypothetical protein